MEKAVELLQAVQACQDETGSDILHKARLTALAKILVELLGTDAADELRRILFMLD